MLMLFTPPSEQLHRVVDGARGLLRLPLPQSKILGVRDRFNRSAAIVRVARDTKSPSWRPRPQLNCLRKSPNSSAPERRSDCFQGIEAILMQPDQQLRGLVIAHARAHAGERRIERGVGSRRR